MHVASIRATPEIIYRKHLIPDMVILGIPITYTDEVEKRVFYDRVLNKNQDLRVPLRPIFNSSNIYVPLETDFTERIYIY